MTQEVSSDERPELTILFPCFNEEQAVGESVRQAWDVLKEHGIRGEVLVVDNNSSDSSSTVAAEAGARVVLELAPGYGSALRRGLEESKGEFVLLLDADGTYPIEKTPEFLRRLRSGADLVIGNRFSGDIDSNAMPLMNRVLGNPLLSWLTRRLFAIPVRDVHCGMRAVRRSLVPSLHLRTNGMEFATEMIVRAFDRDLHVSQVNIPYRVRIGPSKLDPFKDGWRHIEYMLSLSPGALFLWPGLVMVALGLTIQLFLLPGPRFFLFRSWDYHASMAGMVIVLIGGTFLGVGVIVANVTPVFGIRSSHSWITRTSVERGDSFLRTSGGLLGSIGIVMWTYVVVGWMADGFGVLAAVSELALASSLALLGVVLAMSAFVVRMIRVHAGLGPE
jgi:glycosyltransferase involved in cell wall biosynthesis